ncbi:MAG: amidohydrolase family protein [Candidatus Omnitrophica bacterium]|nr:amidohydrolase family protein [Candidatus Omnitrophota bacterium]
MIIDAHTHIHRDPRAFGKGLDASAENLVRSLKRAGVDKAVVLPIYPDVSNEFVAEVCAQYPRHLIGFASVDPADKKALKQLDACVGKRHLQGLKIHPRVQRISPNDPRVIRLVTLAAEIGIPVVLDCFPQYSAAFEVEKTFPQRIGELARAVPGARIIMAHAGGYKMWDAFFVARAHPNIYLDFSFSPQYFKGSSLWQDLGFILKKLGAHRCIYGSDHPEVSVGESLTAARRLIAPLRLSVREKEWFFGKTFLSVLSREASRE